MKGPSINRIGKYRLLAELGQGSMGIVYRAVDEQGLEVALKTMAAGLKQDSELRKRFYLEGEVVRKMSHPGIIRLHDLGEADDHLYMAMELLDGRDLKAIIRAGPTESIARRIEWMKQLADAVGHAHANGIIHRDIKPGNIHVRSNGNIVVMDFGIARTATSRITVGGAILGTPEYISPEQVLAIRVDHRADIFSLGLVFYELLTGIHPFRSKNVPATVHRILNERPASPDTVNKEVPPGVSAVVMKMIEKDANLRYQSCEQVLRDLL